MRFTTTAALAAALAVSAAQLHRPATHPAWDKHADERGFAWGEEPEHKIAVRDAFEAYEDHSGHPESIHHFQDRPSADHLRRDAKTEWEAEHGGQAPKYFAHHEAAEFDVPHAHYARDHAAAAEKAPQAGFRKSFGLHLRDAHTDEELEKAPEAHFRKFFGRSAPAEEEMEWEAEMAPFGSESHGTKHSARSAPKDEKEWEEEMAHHKMSGWEPHGAKHPARDARMPLEFVEGFPTRAQYAHHARSEPYEMIHEDSHDVVEPTHATTHRASHSATRTWASGTHPTESHWGPAPSLGLKEMHVARALKEAYNSLIYKPHANYEAEHSSSEMYGPKMTAPVKMHHAAPSTEMDHEDEIDEGKKHSHSHEPSKTHAHPLASVAAKLTDLLSQFTGHPSVHARAVPAGWVAEETMWENEHASATSHETWPTESHTWPSWVQKTGEQTASSRSPFKFPW